MSFLGIFLGFILVENLLLTKFLGICPFIGISTDAKASAGLSVTIAFVMAFSALITWTVNTALLIPLNLDFLQTIVFLLVIVFFIQLTEELLKRLSPGFFRLLGRFLPLLTANCAVFGICLIAARRNFGPLESFTAGLSAGIGFFLITSALSAIRERLSREWIPKPFQGVPIAFITIGLIALAFLAFDRAFLSNLLG
jgi:electron transport complex protein RnfA